MSHSGKGQPPSPPPSPAAQPRTHVGRPGLAERTGWLGGAGGWLRVSAPPSPGRGFQGLGRRNCAEQELARAADGEAGSGALIPSAQCSRGGKEQQGLCQGLHWGWGPELGKLWGRGAGGSRAELRQGRIPPPARLPPPSSAGLVVPDPCALWARALGMPSSEAGGPIGFCHLSEAICVPNPYQPFAARLPALRVLGPLHPPGPVPALPRCTRHSHGREARRSAVLGSRLPSPGKRGVKGAVGKQGGFLERARTHRSQEVA